MVISPRPTPAGAVLTRGQARVVWTGLALLLVVAVVATLLAPGILGTVPDREIAWILLPAVALVTAADLAMSYVVTGTIRKRAASAGAPAREAAAGTQTIVASALAIGAAIFACVGHFVTGDKLFVLLVLPCAAVLVHWFPSESRWARITPAGPADAPPPRRMMRE
jgi:hypothetical protein